MAMVFQSYALWPHMTTAQNLGYGLKLRRVPKPRDRAARRRDPGAAQARGLRRAQRDAALRRPAPARGARPRARHQPGAPAARRAALQPRRAHPRRACATRSRRCRQKLGITTIHVTHDREEAMVMADRIAILDAGRIAQLGSPEEVYNRPNSPFVAAFMGADNVLELEARPADGGIRDRGGRAQRRACLQYRGSMPCAGPGGGAFPQRGGAARSRPTLRRADRLLLRGRIAQARIPAVSTATRSHVGAESVHGGRHPAPRGRRDGRASGCRSLRCISFRGGKHETQSRVGRLSCVTGGGARRARPARRRSKIDAQRGHRRRPEHGRLRQGLSSAPQFEKTNPNATVRAVGTGPGDAGSQKIDEKLAGAEGGAAPGTSTSR